MPTISIAGWKLAFNLTETRRIQNQPGTPAQGCDCKDCTTWKSVFRDVFPADIRDSLERIGIDLRHPTDIYEFDEDDCGLGYRVVYHAVGRYLEGPNACRQMTESSHSDIVTMYQRLREEPWLSLVVMPDRMSFADAPSYEDGPAGELIAIDFRLTVPRSLVEFIQVRCARPETV